MFFPNRLTILALFYTFEYYALDRTLTQKLNIKSLLAQFKRSTLDFLLRLLLFSVIQ